MTKAYKYPRTTTIDIEPKWADLCMISERGALRPKELLPACKIADVVRQAQKHGAKSVSFSFKRGSHESLVKVRK